MSASGIDCQIIPNIKQFEVELEASGSPNALRPGLAGVCLGPLSGPVCLAVRPQLTRSKEIPELR